MGSLESRYPALEVIEIKSLSPNEKSLSEPSAARCSTILFVGPDKKNYKSQIKAVLEFVIQVRKDDRYHSIPCVCIDLSNTPENHINLYRAGFSEIITPPVHSHQLKLTLQRHLSLGRRIRNLEAEIHRVRRLKDLAMDMAKKKTQAITKNIERLESEKEKEREARDAMFEMSRHELLALNEKIKKQHQQEIQSLTEKAHIEAMFGRYVSPEIAEMALDPVKSEELSGARKDITVMFIDIRGFTSMTESQKPERTILILNEFFTEMTEIIHRSKGWVDKYIGDSIMALFGSPLQLQDHVEVGFRVAMELLDHFEIIRQEWKEMLNVQAGLGIGLATGDVIVGNIGSIQKISYTAIGDTVNVAARLEGLAEPGTALMTGDFYEKIDRRIAEIYEIRSTGSVLLKGKSKPVDVYCAGPGLKEAMENPAREESIGR